MALGMAAHILFMRSEMNPDGKYYGSYNGKSYQVNDDNAVYYANAWKETDLAVLVKNILSNRELWEADLSSWNGFKDAVVYWLDLMNGKGISYAIQEATKQKAIVVNEK